MKFKEVATSNASTEAKVAALALLLDKELIKLADTVLNVKKLEGPKGEQGIQGPKGEQGDRGFDGTNGKDGADGKDGKDGEDGKQGVGVADAKIDFDGSLVITLTDGTEINAGDVVPLDTAEKIRVIGNGGGTSQSVLDAIDAINAIISTYGTMALQDDTAVDINGGAIDGTAIGAAVPATGVFTTLTATTGDFKNGNTDTANTACQQVFEYGGSGNGYKHFITSNHNNANSIGNSIKFWLNYSSSASGSSAVGTNNINTFTNDLYSTSIKTYGGTQFNVAHTASAVNYVQVTGAATTATPVISAQGSDSQIDLALTAKGTNGWISLNTNSIRQVAIVPAASAVNYWTLTGSATTKSPVVGVLGTDTNISQVFQSKGTGAIDLAAGSRGVNISNGGTVTAITRTASGTLYTSFPSVAVTAPTTAGGVQATVSVAFMQSQAATIASGGTGYTVNDVLTISGGTPTSTAATFTVTAVSGGVITTVTATNFATYSALPTNPVSVTGGTGSGATLNATWGLSGNAGSFTITNAGSGYVEQPTVSFSGGGGSGAAAYATVGSGTVIRSIGSAGIGSIDFNTPASATNGVPALRIRDVLSSTPSNTGYFLLHNNNGYAQLTAQGPTDAQMAIGASGAGYIRFNTNGTGETNQMRVTHTASAVNYVQVTGAATGSTPVISAQGSDASANLAFSAKGASNINFFASSGSGRVFTVNGSSGASTANYLQAAGGLTTVSPVLSSQGTDTNIDLTLTPKGTGNVRFGTYTANMALTVQGYIEIKDSGGTVRKLAVIA